ncbi:MAG: two-component regulator propeller domain-containing protein [Lentimicrobiaceae bacterium]|jgi:ligand-binding sensor domain-containing protein/signal transduction histidine kinase
MYKKTVLILFLFLYCFAGNAQQYFFSGYSISDGLSQSVVNCIFQDSKGYIWFGTQNGLNKYNGYTFEVFTYNPNDSNSISNNWIIGITEDIEANLWIATKGGLVKYTRKEKRFSKINYSPPFDALVTDCIYDVKCTRNGNILINMPPVLSEYDPKTLKFRHFISPFTFDGSAKDNNIPLLEDTKGTIWVASTKGLAAFNPVTKSFSVFNHNSADPTSLSDDNITALYQDKKGELWIGTSSGLNHLKAGGTRFEHYFQDKRSEFSLSNNFIRAILADKSGTLWVATEGGGLNRMSRGKDNRVFFERFSAEKSGLNHNINLSLAIDNSDNLWIGTLSGINKTNLKKRNFSLYRKSDSPYSVDLAGNVIASIYEDENNVIWIGNWGQGLNLYNRATGEVEHYSSRQAGKYRIPNDYIHCIFEDKMHTIWIGTRDGLLVYEQQGRRFVRPEEHFKHKRFPDFPGLRINRMIQDHLGNYWIATHDGLYKMQRSGLSPDHFYAGAIPGFRISSNLVYAVLEDRDGAIWVGTINGLDVIDPIKGGITHFRKSEKQENSLSDNFITALCEDQHGDIWIGTNSYVNRYSKKNGTFRYYSGDQGFPSNLVYSIREDKLHFLWFATGNGLCRFDTATNKFRTYTVEDGLQSPEFNLGASFRSADGEMFFGGMNGFNSFYPDSLSDNPHIPIIAITAAYKFNKGVREYLNLEQEGPIILNHSENTFTIEFAALEFTNPAKNRYAYKLEGADDDWNDIGSRNFVSFTNLPPGNYTMRVKGCNNDGRWNETGVSLSIIIHPPWWKSKVAYVAYFLLGIFLIFLYIKVRERNHIRELKILEEKVKVRTQLIEEQKSEILNKNSELNELNTAKDKFFSIIAHDLRNPFNAIIGLTDILLINLDNVDIRKLQKTLENIKGSSQQAHELLENLLLWARSQTGTISFRPETIDLKLQAEESIELVSVQAARKNISIIADFNTPVLISGDINMMNTILRNLLTNALKFTPRNGEVRVGISQNNGFCILSIKDNGIGIPAEKLKHLFSIDTAHKTKGTDQEPGTGLGLILCKEFIEKHGGRLEVESEAGKGSEFRVIIPGNRDDGL